MTLKYWGTMNEMVRVRKGGKVEKRLKRGDI